MDGKPGLPGDNAGNFFISTFENFNIKNLKFIAQAGQGGQGQEGTFALKTNYLN